MTWLASIPLYGNLDTPPSFNDKEVVDVKRRDRWGEISSVKVDPPCT
jgi:hypothetical protein